MKPKAMIKNKDKIETDLELFRDLINKSNDAIFVNDPQTSLFIFVNDKACATLGYDRQELLKMGVMDIEVTFPDNFLWQAHVNELQRRGSHIMEGIHKRKNGTTFPVEINVSYVVLNTRKYMLAVVRDISERKRAEKEIAEHGALVQQIMDTASVGIGLVDKSGRITHANRSMAEMFGCMMEELIGSEYADHVHPSERETSRRNMLALLASAIPSVNLARRYMRKDGTEFWGHLECRRFHDAQGNERGLIGVITDITERKRAEEALTTSEKRYRHLFEDSPVSLWEEDISELQAHIAVLRSAGITDLGAHFTNHPEEVFKCVGLVKVISVNKTTLDLYEAPDQATLLHGLSQVFTARSFDAFRGILISLSTGAQMYECETVNQTLTGRTIDVLLRWTLISNDQPNRSRALISIVDITERKQAGEVKDSLVKAISAATEGIAITDDKDRFIYVNDAHARIYGYIRDELIGKTWRDTVSPDLELIIERDFEKTLHNRAVGIWSGQAFAIRKDGTVVPTEITATSRWGETGNYLGHICIVRDITERKRAEENYRLLFESANDGIFIQDETGFTDCNQKGAEMYGLTKEEIIGRSPSEFAPKQQPDGRLSSEVAAEKIRAALNGVPQVFEWQPLRADGTPFDVEITLTRLELGSRICSQAIVRDITERKRTEEEREKLQAQLYQSQKIESVGRLAGGVAHDFNNMLSAILGYTEMAMMEGTPPETIHAYLKVIEQSALRSADLVRQLLAFARKQIVAPKVLVLNDTVAGLLKMLQRLMGEDIDFTWMPGVGLWPVRIDPSQIDQLLANLCINARDAITGVGKITIETRNAAFGETYCAVNPGFVPGEYVMLAVRDNGCGMSKEVFDHLFEPFFTTKEAGKGTGLGLATVYGIVKQNNGIINVSSEPGKGSTIKIFLPRFAGEAIEPATVSRTETPKGHGETVLLVEDEASILNMGQDMLEALGYRVLTAGTPTEAISQVKTHTGEIDLLVTDMVMPEMNGWDLAKLLCEINPGLKCLFSSAYTVDVIAHQGVLDKGVHFLQKPFSRKDLATKVREVLEGE